MLVWIIYDITSDKRRRHVIKQSQNEGLYRVQKSVFCGSIDNSSLDELILKCKEIIETDQEPGNEDSVYVFPLCEKDFKRVKIIGKGFNKDLVSDKIRSLVL